MMAYNDFRSILYISVALILVREYLTPIRPLQLAIISIAGNPLDPPSQLSMCGKGGQSPYVREVGKHLSNLGFNVTIFTRSESPKDVGEVILSPTLRVKYIVAGPQHHIHRDEKYYHLDNFTSQINKAEFDAVFSNYWLSG